MKYTASMEVYANERQEVHVSNYFFETLHLKAELSLMLQRRLLIFVSI